MREEFRRKMREDIDLLGSLVDTLNSLRERAEAGFDCIEQAEEEGWELAPMMDIGQRIHSARTKCLAFDAYFEEKYGAEKEGEA
jgi:hypothetical protein|nr:MAG TPA: hypothetical protein [Siphoviridae sp. ctjRi1]